LISGTQSHLPSYAFGIFQCEVSLLQLHEEVNVSQVIEHLGFISSHIINADPKL